jgi:hypothetical protein
LAALPDHELLRIEHFGRSCLRAIADMRAASERLKPADC